MEKSYLELLKDPRWQKKRLKIMERDNFTCQICKDKETSLNVHHKRYVKGRLPWQYTDKDLLTVCEDCHNLIKHITEINLCNCTIPIKSIHTDYNTYYILSKERNYLMLYIYQKRGNSVFFIDQLPFCMFRKSLKEMEYEKDSTKG
jgi:hypothetical protein